MKFKFEDHPTFLSLTIDKSKGIFTLLGKDTDAMHALSKKLVYFRKLYEMDNVNVGVDVFRVKSEGTKLRIEGNLSVAFDVIKALKIIPQSLSHEIEGVIHPIQTKFFKEDTTPKEESKELSLADKVMQDISSSGLSESQKKEFYIHLGKRLGLIAKTDSSNNELQVK